MKKIVLCVMAVAMIAGSAFANGQSDASSSSAAKPVVLKYGELNPEGNLMSDTAAEFARIVKEKSNGSLIIDVYLGSQLGDERVETQALQMGAQDLFRANTVSLADYGAKMSNIFALPYLFRDRTHLWKVLNGEIGDKILADVQASGSKMVGLGYWEEGSRNFFFTDKPVTRLADLKGQKIRVPQTQMLMDTVAALGGSPTPISYSELYTALQTGVVDGAENPPTGYWSNNFYEVAPYYSLDGHTYSPSMLVMSEITWNKLSDEHKAILKEATKEAGVFNANKAAKTDADVFASLKEKGIQVLQIEDLADWPKAIQPVYDKYGADYKAIIDAIHAVN